MEVSVVTTTNSGIELGGVPGWANRFLEDLDRKFGVLSGDLAETNFPDGNVPRWLRENRNEQTDDAPGWIDSFFLDGERGLQELWLERGFLREDPVWLANLLERERAKVARVFVLHGNIHDYAFSPDEGYMPVIDRIEANAVRRKDWVIRYSLSNGFSRPTRGTTTPEDQPTPLEELGLDDAERSRGMDSVANPRKAIHEDFRVMEEILRESYDQGVCLVVENLHMLLPSDSRNVDRNALSDAIQRWAQAPWMFESKNSVVLLADTLESLDSELRSRSSHIEPIEIPRPTGSKERLKFLTALFANSNVDPMIGTRMDNAGQLRFGSDFGSTMAARLNRLADRTSGLNLVGLENLALQVDVRDEKTFTLDFIKDAKRDILSRESGGLLRVTEPDPSVDRNEAFSHVGGLDKVRDKLLDISQLMNEGGDSEVIRGALPKGLLFLGPPGTGKTLVARAFANACGMNFAEFENIRSKWVGETERNLSKALGLIRSLKPVIVFLDEIDKSLGQGSGEADSGVDQRIFARMLQFMSDPELEGEVVWIAASNRPDEIDPALKRTGRFDLTVPFLRPSEEARRQIFEIQFRNRGGAVDFSAEEWDELVARTEGFTGAEIEGLVKEAIWQTLVEDPNDRPVEVTYKDVIDAFEAYQPPVDRGDYQAMEERALLETTAVGLLSSEDRQRRERLLEHGGAGD